MWNQCVGRADELRHDGYTCGPAELDKELTDWRNNDSRQGEWLRAGSSVPQQQMIRDWGKSRAKAFKDLKTGVPFKQRAGFPTFKSKRVALLSMNFTTRGFSYQNSRLTLAGGIGAVVVESRQLPSPPSSVRVSRDASGWWWASFVCKVNEDDLAACGQAIGVDWGVTETAVTTDAAYDLPHHQRGRQLQKKIARSQRQQARRRTKSQRGQKPSRGLIEAKQRTARLYQKAAWQRKDDANKWARHVVNNHDQIAVEDFKPKFLAKTTMARKSADAAIGQAKRILIDRAERAGRNLVLVDPKYTTMDCGECGARAKHRLPLSERTYTCTKCGNIKPRDRNSAAVMVARAGFCLDNNAETTRKGDPASADRGRPETPPGVLAA